MDTLIILRNDYDYVCVDRTANVYIDLRILIMICSDIYLYNIPVWKYLGLQVAVVNDTKIIIHPPE